MFSNFLTVSFRNLWNNKTFSLLNILGLATGIAVFMLIMLWVKNEVSYNSFHTDSDRIAQVITNQPFENGEIATFTAVPTKLKAALQADLPGVEYATRVTWGDVRQFSVDEKNFSEYGLYVDPEFLKVFTFPLIKGDASGVLKEPNTILLTEKLAEKYFGTADPVGKTIMIEQRTPFKVVGVLKNVPANSSIRFDYLMPMQDYINTAMGGVEGWESNNIKTYVKLKASADMAAVSASMGGFMKKYTDEQPKSTLRLFAMKDWYLRFDFKNGVYAGGGRITYVNIFIITAIFILLLACINFMNLSTARATQRAKEVGVRKVSGADRKSLIIQFICESILYAFLAGLIAIILVALTLPWFNTFLGKAISIDYLNPVYIGGFFSIILVTGFLAGSYPALVLSSFNPAKVLKGLSGAGMPDTAFVRKALVVVQFTVSVLLIIGTIVVYTQVQYIKNKHLGYDKENLVWFSNNIPADKNETALQEFRKVPGVTQVSQASMTFTSPNNRGDAVEWPGKKEGQRILFSFITGGYDIIQTMGIKLKEGRTFSAQVTTDTGSFILNEEAVKRMGLTNPVGQYIETYGGKGRIVGVVEDFHIESLHQPIAPVIIECRPEWTWLYYVRLSGQNIQQALQGIEKVYKQFAPGAVFEYEFQDKEYENLYRSELQVGTLVNWFAFFAIFISCLGLLGLTVFTVERKRKEIGVRKVLGASVVQIVSLVSKQFILLVLLSVVLASVPAWYFMNEWLQAYTYRVSISWWVFGIAGGIACVVALCTICFHAVKAAMANPVKSLRTE